jgi:hypothetical protein
MEHGKRHVTHVTSFALHHLHVDAERVRKLPRKECITLFKAIDKHLKRRYHGGAVSRDDFTFGCKFFLLASFSPFRSRSLDQPSAILFIWAVNLVALDDVDREARSDGSRFQVVRKLSEKRLPKTP